MIKEVDEGILVSLKIVPNSSKNDIIIEGNLVKVKITAQPIEGKANKALIEFLSKKSGVPKSKIEIVKGETSKEKTLLFKVAEKVKKEHVASLFV